MRAPANSPVTRLAQASLQQAHTALLLARTERIQAVQHARDVGLSHEQIGTVLGITEAAVRCILRRNPGGTA